MRWMIVIGLLMGAGVASAEPVKLRMGTMAIDGSRYMKDVLALSQEIERRTRGAVRIDWVPDGRLGDEREMARQIAGGKLDGGGFGETGLAALVPEMVVWGNPGLFRGYEEVDRATAALTPETRERFAKRDLVFVMWADLGFSRLFSMEQGGLQELFARAAPWITMPIDGKLIGEITSGRARAWTLPPLYTIAIGARARYMSALRYRYVVGGWVVSKAAWSRLRPADQATVLEVCKEWEPRLRASWRRETERGIAALEKGGTRILPVSDAELAGFLEGAARSRTEHAARWGLSELLNKIGSALTR